MPGVPSSKGCDACRKQKKKCDQLSPSCTRCRRLRIPCTGAGSQRWKFQDQLVRGSSSTTLTQISKMQEILAMSIPTNLDSQNSKAARHLISIWKCDDIRFDISVFGDYFMLVPSRLGHNDALDAATWAFTCAYPTFYTKAPTSEALQAYNIALRKIRKAIEDPKLRYTQDTLCALQIMNCCQIALSKPGDHYVHHSRVIAHLLPEMLKQGWTDLYGRALLVYASIVVIVSAMLISSIDTEYDSLKELLKSMAPARPLVGMRGHTLPSAELHRLLRLPKWCKSPLVHIEDMKSAYKQCLVDIELMRNRLTNMQLIISPVASQEAERDEVAEAFCKLKNVPMKKFYAQLQSAQGLLLAVAIFLNATIRSVDDPFDWNADLEKEARHLTNRLEQLCEDMLDLRPLYSSGLGMTLVVAWGAERDLKVREQITAWMDLFNIVAVGDDWSTGGLWFQTYLKCWREAMRRHARATNATVPSITETAASDDSAPEPVVETPDAREIFLHVENEHSIGRCTIL